MGAVATPAAPQRSGLPRRRAGQLFEPGRPTLDDRVSATWRRLVDDGAAECLVCGAEAPAGRECPGCGSELS